MIIENIGHATLNIRTTKRNVLTDPWLTKDLDRFWTHSPDIESYDFLKSIDTIIITHHHYDHLHFRSLDKINRDVDVFYPASESKPVFAGSGMGFKAIPWTLRQLGFHKLHPVKAFDEVELDDLRFQCFPSKVNFPELGFLFEHDNKRAMFCGDTLLHPDTIEYFEREQPHIDCAFIPAHSTAPGDPLLRRKHVDNYQEYIDRSIKTLDTYVNTINADLTILTAFGWKIHDPDFQWVNNLLFPFTPLQAREHLHKQGREASLIGPHDCVMFAADGPMLEGYYYNHHDILEKNYRALALDPGTEIKAFEPQLKARKTSLQAESDLVNKTMAAIIGTPYWNTNLDNGTQSLLSLSGDNTTSHYLFDFKNVRVQKIEYIPDPTVPMTWCHVDDYAALLNSELLLSSAYGLYVSDDSLLTSVFHHPAYYVNHVTDWQANHDR